METSILQDNLEVLTSGVIISNKETKTKIVLEKEFEIHISFEDSIKDEIITETLGGIIGVKLILKGFNNSLGTSTSKPLPIAKREDKKVFISFCVHAIKGTKILTYNILGEV